MKAVREDAVTLVNLKLQVMQEKEIKMEVCSVGGHNKHGLVERVIRSLQESLPECGGTSNHLTATGLQTLCKLVENDYNNLPIGFKYDKRPRQYRNFEDFDSKYDEIGQNKYQSSLWSSKAT